MKLLKLNKKVILIAVGLLVLLLVVKMALVLTAKPKITVDYVAEYNRITRPENYDPNDNAAPYYQKTFDAFVGMPSEIQERSSTDWPADLNSTEQAILKEWLTSNSQTFEYFRIAADKPYYWIERQTGKDNDMMSVMFPERSSLRNLINALLWNAKLAALKGRTQAAFENIIDCYQAGCQKCRAPSLLIDQLVGMRLKRKAIDSALVILDETRIDSSDLKSFQDSLQTEFDRDTYVLDFEAEKMVLYDILQRTFVDNNRGTGRLTWRATRDLIPMHHDWRNLKVYLNCFWGPTRNQTIEQIGKVFTIYNQVVTKTPWQVKNEGRDYFGETEKINSNNLILSVFGINSTSIFRLYHETRTQTEALITILAILRFKEENHRLPISLEELVSGGYLKSVPMDPYSNGPLVYKLTEDNFKLYSVGEDFVDDGGSNEDKTKHLSGLDIDKVHIISREYTPDIVYWPVKRSERHLETHTGETNEMPQN